jgi:hypothetical protein
LEVLSELKGQNGILYICEEYIEISRKSFGGFISQGGKGNRKFYYSDINSIEYKTPTLLGNGYFKVIAGGTQDIDAKVGIISSSMNSMKDPNTVILRAFKKAVSQKCNEAYEIAMNQLKSNKSSTPAATSNLDELKKLGELLSSGVLTQDEFNQEKRKLLSKT